MGKAAPMYLLAAFALPLLTFICTNIRAEPAAREFTFAQLATLDQDVRVSAQTGDTRPAVEFTDVTAQAGLRWSITRLAPGVRYLIDTMGGGGGFLDYNNDGFLDILFVAYSRTPQTPNGALVYDALYRNNGNGTFTDVTQSAGIATGMVGMGLVVADYDNDGWPDVFISGYNNAKLYRNDHHGKFVDVTSASGIEDKFWGAGAAFLDYDSDGFPDLFIANYLNFDPDGKVPCDLFDGRPYCYLNKFKGAPSLLYHNNRNGTFTDVSRKAGIAGLDGKGLGVLAFDFNNDGNVDIFQANDTAPNFLFRNNGNGTFTDVALEADCALDQNGDVRGGMGVDAEDVDGDGFLDLFVTNFSGQTNAFWHNNGDGTFNEVTEQLGLGKVSLPMSGFGTRFIDYNNDGLIDLFVLNGHPFEPIQKVFPNVTYREPPFLFENTGNGFREVAAEHGNALKRPMSGRGLAVGDIDNDGDADLLLLTAGEAPVLLRNDGGNRNNWLGVRLVGSKSNRDGIGATVTIKLGATIRRKQILSGAGYFSSSDARLLFGLNHARKVDQIEVRWPSGAVTSLKDIEVNRYLTITETPKIEKIGARMLRVGISRRDRTEAEHAEKKGFLPDSSERHQLRFHAHDFLSALCFFAVSAGT